MAHNVVVGYPGGHLDPTAQEFRPTYPAQQHHFPFFPPPLQPPPPPPHLVGGYYPPQLPDMIYPPQQPPPIPPPPQPTFLPPSMPPAASAPTRAVLLSAVPPEVSESCLRRDLEVFGDVRAVQMERVREGIVTVHFYDLRAACAALDAVRDQHMQHQHRLRHHFSTFISSNLNYPIGPGFEAQQHLPPPLPPPPPPPAPGLISGRAVWAHFTIPTTHAFPDGHNQGTIVIFNLDPNVSAPTLKNIFKIYGAVKELRETPMKRQQRFVEFYDVRDAATALAEMNGREINGRSVMIEYSRPGGYIHKKFLNYHNNNNYSNTNHHHYNQQHPNYHNHNHNHVINNNNNNNNNPLPLTPSPPPPPTPPPPSQTRILQFRSRRTHPPPAATRRRRSSPSSEESVEAAMSRISLRPGNGNGNGNGRNCGGNSVGKGNVNGNGNCSSPGSGSGSGSSGTTTKQNKGVNRGWKGRQQKNYDPRYLIKEEAIIISSGGVQDIRTTVMIKNIPNKYSQKLLLNMLDNHCIHCNEQIAVGRDEKQHQHQHQQPLSSYDFVYLPIDFNNKCNVGYGFVNMTSPEATLRLYKSFHHQHWEVFNSRKICEVTYARVQGLEALKEHFKNSKFACENDEYLPVVFTPPRNGRNLTTPLPIVFSNTLGLTASPTVDQPTYVDGVDFTSSATSTITTQPTSSSSDDFDHDDETAQDDHNDDDASRTSSDGGHDNDDDDRTVCRRQ